MGPPTQRTGPKLESDFTGRMVVPRCVENKYCAQKVLLVMEPTVIDTEEVRLGKRCYRHQRVSSDTRHGGVCQACEYEIEEQTHRRLRHVIVLERGREACHLDQIAIPHLPNHVHGLGTAPLHVAPACLAAIAARRTSILVHEHVVVISRAWLFYSLNKLTKDSGDR